MVIILPCSLLLTHFSCWSHGRSTCPLMKHLLNFSLTILFKMSNYVGDEHGLISVVKFEEGETSRSPYHASAKSREGPPRF